MFNNQENISGQVIFFWIVFQFVAINCFAQPELKIIGRITSGNGLLTDGIKYTMKDAQGFMWFAYEKGFQRWDGYEVKNFEYLNDTTLNSSYRFCRPIIEDRKGNFFIGSLKNGLIKLDRATDSYIRYLNDPDDPASLGGNGIHEMFLDESGSIWIGTFVEGLSKLDPELETFQNYKIVDDSLFHLCNNIRSIFRDSRDTLWIGTEDGLYQFIEENEEFIHIPTFPALPKYLNSFECILEDHFGNMWFGTYWGILKYAHEPDKWEHILTINPDKPSNDADAKVMSLVEFYNKKRCEIWIGTYAGLKVYNLLTGNLTHITPKNGYPEITNAGAVQYLFLDEYNILWASLGGITLIDLNKNPFEIHRLKSFPDSSYDERAYCFYEDDETNIWIGTEANGIYKFDQSLDFIANFKACDWTPEESNTDFNNMCWRIYEDPQGRIWTSTGPTCLSLFNMETGEFSPVYVNVGSYTPGRILIDPYNVVWLSAHDGLFKGTMNDGGLSMELYDNPSLPKVPIDRILYDSNDRLWILTRASGVFCLHPNERWSMKFKRYVHENYRHQFTIEDNAREIIEDNNGDIWFISHNKLYKYDPVLDSIVPDKWFNKNYQGGIYSFIRDKNGIFWIGIDIGLLAYNPKDTLGGGLRIMDYRSGMPFTFLTRNNFFVDSKGYIYQGGQMTTERGFFRFHPDSMPAPNCQPPPTFLTNFNIRNNFYRLDSNITYKKKITLEYNMNFFSFEFAALDYHGPEKNQYAYYLENYDIDWYYVGNRRLANYTGVPPGEYIFKVKGSNNDGYWNEEGTSVAITILPPPWKTWWAYSIYVLFLAGIIYSIFRYYLKRQQLLHNLELEHYQAEKLVELDKMKSRFFANISHEFRTPLTLILGPLEKLRSKIKDYESEEELNIIQRNALRLQNLINQLLSLSKLESGQMKLRAQETNIVSLVNNCVQSFESLAKSKNIELNFQAEEKNIVVFIDRDKLEKIIFNLLSNAFKFTGEGGIVQVKVGSKQYAVGKKESKDFANFQLPSASPGMCVLLKISDTGRGIPSEKLPHIFDRFYQADQTYTKDQEGSGIGLALTKELVELHHGKISVESKLGKGTTFTIWLPMGKEHLRGNEWSDIVESSSTEARAVALHEPEIVVYLDENKNKLAADAYEKDDGKPLLLIVEDNDDLRSYIRSYLMIDYKIHEATDGEKGLAKAIDKIPDLVISDVMMPKMDGMELCKKLKTDERTSHIPVILLTAKAALEDRLEGLETGADDFITKPFDPKELQVRVRNLIWQRKKLQVIFANNFRSPEYLAANDITSIDKKFIQKVTEVIERNLQDAEFNVEHFCIEMNMSRMQLHRKMKALTNQSPGEFIRIIRLNKAAVMLKEKVGNIAEVAYDVGFNNPSYFSECFKKQFGKLPSDFIE